MQKKIFFYLDSLFLNEKNTLGFSHTKRPWKWNDLNKPFTVFIVNR